jgi:hypothetical protein
MKNKVLLLFAFVWFSCTDPEEVPAQTSVPDIETFSLQDVYNVVHGHTPETTFDLLSCFANSVAGYFDPAYNNDSYAPDSSLLRFRNYKHQIINPSTITYQKKWDTGDVKISSIEISTDGRYLYLMYPSPVEWIVRYTLATPFDIASVGGSFQIFSYAFLGETYTFSGGLFLSPDQKQLSYLLDAKVHTSVFQSANDLSVELYTSGYLLSGITASLYSPRDIAYDPSGYFPNVLSYTSSGDMRVVVLQSGSPFEIAGTISYVSQAAFQNPFVAAQGYEFNGDGTKMYIMDVNSGGVLHSYTISPTAYKPSNLNTPDLGSVFWNLSASFVITDYCFSDNLYHTYVVGYDSNSPFTVSIYQYSMND